MALRLEKSETQISYVKNLRKHIAGKPQDETLLLYPLLWQLESKFAPAGEQERLRKRTESDLKFLEGLDQSKFKQVPIILMQGYQRTGNREAMEKYQNSTPSTAPNAFLQARNEWSRANPAPGFNARTQERMDYYKKELQFLEKWRDRLPQFPMLLTARFAALAALPETSNETLVREGNQVLGLLHNSANGILINPTGELEVLKAWAQRGLELDRIPALVHEAQEAKTAAPPGTAIQQSDLYTGYRSLLMGNQRWTMDSNAWSILVMTYLKSHRLDKARSVLAEWEKTLNERRKAAEINGRLAGSGTMTSPLGGMGVSIASGVSNEESWYYDACARLATAEGRRS